METPNTNRVEAEMRTWIAKEEKIASLFSFSKSSGKYLRKEKLNFLSQTAAKYQRNTNADEKLMLRAMKQEIRYLERQIYPNRFLRVMRRMFVGLIRNPYNARRDKQRLLQTRQDVSDQLYKKGFGRLASKAEIQVAKEAPEFKLRDSKYVNENETLNHEITFVRDNEGKYQLRDLNVALRNEAKQSDSKTLLISNDDGYALTREQTYNLLCGRSVEITGRWIKVDFNDQTADGRFKIKELGRIPDYDIKESLKKLSIPEIELDRLTQKLKEGGKQMIQLRNDGDTKQVYVEANPMFRSITIYDEKQRKISLETALGKKNADVLHTQGKAELSEKNRKSLKLNKM